VFSAIFHFVWIFQGSSQWYAHWVSLAGDKVTATAWKRVSKLKAKTNDLTSKCQYSDKNTDISNLVGDGLKLLL
jgi:hypothetical protein